MARYDVDYLYTTGGSPQDSRFRATGVTGFQPLTAKARRQTETESYIRMYRLTPVAAGDARQHEAFAPFRKRTGVLNATDAAGRHR
jgi:hypothetical protein